MEEELSRMPIRPVGIALDGPGKYRVAHTVYDLADFMLGRWPEDEKGDVWRAAMAACLRAFEAQVNGEAARAAFILAAEDADIPMILDEVALAIPQKRARERLPTWKHQEIRTKNRRLSS